MEGLHVPGLQKQVALKMLDFFSRNTDKNYLTPLELAAFAENHLLHLELEPFKELLLQAGITYTADDTPVLLKALRLASLDREILAKDCL